MGSPVCLGSGFPLPPQRDIDPLECGCCHQARAWPELWGHRQGQQGSHSGQGCRGQLALGSPLNGGSESHLDRVRDTVDCGGDTAVWTGLWGRLAQSCP